MQGHVRQRKNRDGTPGAWQAIVSLGVDEHGKRRTIAASAPTKKAAMVLRNKLIAEAGDLVRPDADRPSRQAPVSALFDEFMATAGPHAAQSRYTYRMMYAKHFAPVIGDMQVRQLRGRHLNAVYAAMRDAGLKPATIRKCHTIMSATCSYGAKNEWLSTNPARNASPPKVPRTPVRATAVADIDAMVAALEGEDFGLFVLTSALLGTRRGETLGLQWSDFDFERAQVTIERRVVAVPGGADVVPFTKGDRVRTVAIDGGTVERLRARLMQAQAEMALLDTELASNAFVFCDPVTGRPWHPSTATHRVAKLRKRLGLDAHAHLHGMRHYAATALLAAGVDVRTVAERLGNSPDVVLKVYAHFVPANDQVAAELLGKALAGR